MRTLIAVALTALLCASPASAQKAALTTPFIMALLASLTIIPLERLPYTRKRPRIATRMGRMLAHFLLMCILPELASSLSWAAVLDAGSIRIGHIEVMKLGNKQRLQEKSTQQRYLIRRARLPVNERED